MTRSAAVLRHLPEGFAVGAGATMDRRHQPIDSDPLAVLAQARPLASGVFATHFNSCPVIAVIERKDGFGNKLGQYPVIVFITASPRANCTASRINCIERASVWEVDAATRLPLSGALKPSFSPIQSQRSLSQCTISVESSLRFIVGELPSTRRPRAGQLFDGNLSYAVPSV